MNKILIIAPHAYPVPATKGGAVENLIELYLKHNEKSKKFKIDCVSIEDYESQDKHSNFELTNFIEIKNKKITYKLRKILFFLLNKISKRYFGNVYLREILSMESLKIEEYDAVVIENAPEYGPVIKSKYPESNLILHLHNDYLNFKSKNNQNILQSYNKVMTLSEFVKKRVLEISNANVEVLYNSIDSSKFPRKKSDVKYKDKNEILVVGRMVEEKGIFEAMQSFIKYKQNHKKNNIKMVIIGGADKSFSSKRYYRKILKLASEHPNYFSIVGKVDYEELHNHFSKARLGIVPSKCEDGFNMVALEFITSGVPVIASNKGGIPEVINDNCAVIIEADLDFVERLSKSLEIVLSSDSILMKMSDEALIQSFKFSENKYGGEYEHYLEKSIEMRELNANNKI